MRAISLDPALATGSEQDLREAAMRALRASSPQVDLMMDAIGSTPFMREALASIWALANDPQPSVSGPGMDSFTRTMENSGLGTTFDYASNGVSWSDITAREDSQEVTQRAKEDSGTQHVESLLSEGNRRLKVDPSSAVPYFGEAAIKEGSADAMYKLGYLYMHGTVLDEALHPNATNVEKDIPLGMRFLRAAIEKGHKSARTLYHTKVNEERVCMACGKAHACKKCTCGTRYCDVACQVNAWKHPKTSHKADCKSNFEYSSDINGLIDF